jgi:hypothetical protein
MGGPCIPGFCWAAAAAAHNRAATPTKTPQSGLADETVEESCLELDLMDCDVIPCLSFLQPGSMISAPWGVCRLPPGPLKGLSSNCNFLIFNSLHYFGAGCQVGDFFAASKPAYIMVSNR